jgi:hypothetical protein
MGRIGAVLSEIELIVCWRVAIVAVAVDGSVTLALAVAWMAVAVDVWLWQMC